MTENIAGSIDSRRRDKYAVTNSACWLSAERLSRGDKRSRNIEANFSKDSASIIFSMARKVNSETPVNRLVDDLTTTRFIIIILILFARDNKANLYQNRVKRARARGAGGGGPVL